ncbi:MAG TPA: IS110 family transposase, partial [Dissulfurispiraceae bacterium]|nr:IS110 family transposase [Dissulfurispiraceae bacterium]
WRCPDGTDGAPFAFHNNGRGFQEFWDRVSHAKKLYHLDDIVFGYESTGPYGEPLMHYMRAQGVDMVQVNPMHTKRLKDLQGNSPNKTDQKDPKVIADIIALGHALTVVVPEGPAAELRRLSQARERSNQRYVALVNQLQNQVAVIFPEFLQVMRDIKTLTARCLLEQCPTPKDIVAYGLDNLTRTLKKMSRGKMGQDRAMALYEAAKTSVGITEGLASMTREIRALLVALQATECFTKTLEQQMGHYLKEIPYSGSILSVKGIKEVTAAGLIGEVGDFRKYQSLSEIMKLAGLDLFEISSGKHKGRRHISKRGRPLLRKLLYFAALNTVRRGGIMCHRYQQYRERGMIKTKALIAVARKLLGIIFALVRDQSVYTRDFSRIPLHHKEAA